ncbi:AGAP013540-PA-like protein [Anopheles sinensis]|uniref:AGAP013540-PA-like protein n=1 Tax=Anopheles sinensis TaxID=74873 RepID=A0A084VT45_ANOSI|nr:AGAP013540-PA-like protein [Anopheles sinensis]
MLPQPAAASSARVSSPFDYNGSGAGGRVSGGVGGMGGGGGGGGVGGSLQTSGRISPHAPPTTGMTRSSTKRCLIGRPDPIETKRICDQNFQDERQRSIARYKFDTLTSKFVTSGL